MASRQFRSFTRDSEYRDAKYIVIATEGSETEPRYFEDLALGERYRNPRIHVEVITRENGDESSSSPNHVLDHLIKYDQVHDLIEGDELWMVIDRDKWNPSMLREVAQLVIQKGYFLADSHPCFEMWLLFHHKSLKEYDQETLAAFKENKRIGNRKRLEKELVEICGSYNKSNLRTSDYLPHVDTAIANAKSADSQHDTRWLNQIGSRVYKLVESIIASSPHNPRH